MAHVYGFTPTQVDALTFSQINAIASKPKEQKAEGSLTHQQAASLWRSWKESE